MSMVLLRLLILGAPGSGKGTISKRLVRDFKLKHLASGDILRNQIGLKTPVGVEAEKYLTHGKLVPDPLIVKLIANELSAVQESWLLDGFPRTLPQAEALNKLQSVHAVLNLDVPFDTIRERLTGRWIHEASGRVYHSSWNPPKHRGLDDDTGETLIQRDDDKEKGTSQDVNVKNQPETVQKRLDLYDQATRPLLGYYSNIGVLQSFSGTESDVIYPEVKSFLTGFMKDFNNNTEYSRSREL